MDIKRIGIHLLMVLLVFIFISSCREPITYDLAVIDVSIFYADSKKVLKNKTILINADTIAAIIDVSEDVDASTIINGNNRLVTPGMIDTHIHLTSITGDYERAPEVFHPDSIPVYRERLADEYLAYGVTTIRDVGHPEKWLDVTLQWQKDSDPEYPSFYTCGGAIISDEEREPYIGHVEVQDSEDAANKVQEYYDKGIRHIKLYWRLREPEMRSVVATADSLGMNICGHIDINIVFIQMALDLGVKHFEHTCTPYMSVFNYDKHWKDFHRKYQQNFENESYWTLMLEVVRYVDSIPELKAELIELFDEMAKNDATLSSTTHLFGSIVNRTTHKTLMQTKKGNEEKFDKLTEVQLQRLSEDFDILMSYNKMAHDKGIKLRIGTDCINGGRAVLSEMLLFFEAGFSIKDILQIATINGANALDLGDKYGSIEVGKRADLVIFEQDPFDDYKNFLSKKIIVKNGKIYRND